MYIGGEMGERTAGRWKEIKGMVGLYSGKELGSDVILIRLLMGVCCEEGKEKQQCGRKFFFFKFESKILNLNG
jgi:hypothetical protein